MREKIFLRQLCTDVKKASSNQIAFFWSVELRSKLNPMRLFKGPVYLKRINLF